MPGPRRSTYLVTGGDPFSKLSVRDDGSVHIKGLTAARHVQVRQSGILNGLGIVNIEFNKSPEGLLNLPFDPPARQGLHITSDTKSNSSTVINFLEMWGIHLPNEAAIETGEWNTWFDSSDDYLQRSRQPDLEVEWENAAAFRIATNPELDEITVELWYPEQTWDTSESAPTELGIFVSKFQSQEFILKGRVRKLGTDEQSEPMMFKWYPKHVNYNKTAKVSISEPYGLHPELVLQINGEPPGPKCRLFAQVDLALNLFLDQYQLDDLPRMMPASKLVALWGEKDLEIPEWQVSVPSSSLFQLYDSANATYRLPLHTRYVLPTNSMSVDGIIGAPYLFWACQNVNSERLLEHLPPRETIGIDSVFPLDETSLHIWKTNSVAYRIPAISDEAEVFVGKCTTLVVLLGAGCIIASVLFTLLRQKRKLKVE